MGLLICVGFLALAFGVYPLVMIFYPKWKMNRELKRQKKKIAELLYLLYKSTRRK